MAEYAVDPINVLLVEDDEVDIESIYRVFEKINLPIQWHIVQNGASALDLLYTRDHAKKLKMTPQLIIMDINMPRMNGIDFLRLIRTDPKLDITKVLILTTSNNINDRLAVANLSIDGYIMKPIKKNEIINFLKKIGWNIV